MRYSGVEAEDIKRVNKKKEKEMNSVRAVVSSVVVLSSVLVGNEVIAANLVGPGTLSISGSVNFKQEVISNNGTPGNLVDDISRTIVNFLPNVNSEGDGIAAIPFNGGTGGFSSFNSSNPVTAFINFNSLIGDAVIDQSLGAPFISGPIANFIELKDEFGAATGTTFTLEKVDLPVYVTTPATVPGGQVFTTATLNVYGTWFDAVSGKSYDGQGQFSSQFVGFGSETAVLTALRGPAGFTTSYSASLDAVQAVPEPATLLGLAAFGLLSVTTLRKAKAKVD